MTQPRFATRDTESGMAGLGAPPPRAKVEHTEEGPEPGL